MAASRIKKRIDKTPMQKKAAAERAAELEAKRLAEEWNTYVEEMLESIKAGDLDDHLDSMADALNARIDLLADDAGDEDALDDDDDEEESPAPTVMPAQGVPLLAAPGPTTTHVMWAWELKGKTCFIKPQQHIVGIERCRVVVTKVNRTTVSVKWADNPIGVVGSRARFVMQPGLQFRCPISWLDVQLRNTK